ncbi:MAG TPA: TIR domain-containing protein [Chthoniobacterales bacterium]
MAHIADDRRVAVFAAFVSYRHSEPDRKWAIWLHSSLERYRVPKRLARRLGASGRIGRVFRDEEELAATSDLSTSIREALEASEYLIVVCSPRTPQSKWVNAEIEHFRSLGRHDRILALLIDGEPGEAFPPALREIRRSAVEAGGRGREELEELEPLAADVRESEMDSRAFRKQMAKLRLLATILGCRFDDLRQREQERRVRYLAFGTAFLLVLALVISSLGLWAEANRRIAVTERDRALRNQSRFLAGLSHRETASGNATAGILLALEALPHDLDRPERPYVDEAEIALHQAIYERRELAVFHHASPIQRAAFDAQGKRLFTLAKDGSLQLWDGYDGSRIASVGRNAPVRQADFSPDGSRLLTVSDAGVAQLWSASDGAELATFGNPDEPIEKGFFSPNGERLLTYSKAAGTRLWDTASGRQIAFLGKGIFGAFSPDGRIMLAVSFDGVARLWDIVEDREIGTLLRGGFGLLPGTFSRDGSRLLISSIDGSVRVWEIPSGREITSVQAGPFLMNAALSPDGRFLLTAPLPGPARVWDVASEEVVATLGSFGRNIQRAFFSPDGKRVVTAHQLEGGAWLWDTASGRELANVGTEPVFSPDGTRFVTVGDGAHLWETAAARQLAILPHDAPASGSNVVFSHSGAVDSVVFSIDGERFLTASQDGTARIWGAADGKELVVLRGHTAPVQQAIFSSDGTRVLTTSQDGTARLWEGLGGAEVMVLKTAAGSTIHRAVFSPDGAHILTTAGENVARLWDASTGKELVVLRGHQAAVVSAAFSPDGSRALTVSDDATARVWNLSDGAELASMVGHNSKVREAVFNADGTRVLTRADDRTARVWDAANGRELAILRHDGALSSVAFSPDGARIVTIALGPDELTSNWVGTAYLWDSISGNQLAVLRGPGGYITKAVFSPDGKRVLTASQNRTARVWDLRDGHELMALPGHEDEVVDPAFSPDGRRILTVAYDEVARLWDSDSGRELMVLRDPIGVRGALLSPDGSRVLTFSSGVAAAQLWDAASGREIAVLRGHENPINIAAFSPDSARVVTYSQLDGTVRLWDTPSGRQLAVLSKDRIKQIAFAPDSSGVMTVSEDGVVRIFPVFPTSNAAITHALKVVPRHLTSDDRKRYFLAADTREAENGDH